MPETLAGNTKLPNDQTSHVPHRHYTRTMNNKDISRASWDTRNIEEMNMILCQCHNRDIVARVWCCFVVDPRERGVLLAALRRSMSRCQRVLWESRI